MKATTYPCVCPSCKSDAIDKVEEEQIDDDFHSERWTCTDCGFDWTAQFEFIKWFPGHDDGGEDDDF